MQLMAEQETPTHGTDLSDLVRDRRTELGLSYDRLGRRAVDPEGTGTRIPGSWFHRLETGLAVQVPDLPRLRAIAAALDLPLGRIQDAAGAQFFGIETVWNASGEARAMVTRAERLTPEQRQQIYRLIDTFAPGEHNE